MEKPDVSALLGELEPTTEYAEFLKLWPDIADALARRINRKAIYKALAEQNLFTSSYVTFTRFVKKKQSEGADNNSGQRRGPARAQDWGAVSSTGAIGESVVIHEPAQPEADNSDKSETVATPAADALTKAKQTSTSKNYAKNVRHRT